MKGNPPWPVNTPFRYCPSNYLTCQRPVPNRCLTVQPSSFPSARIPFDAFVSLAEFPLRVLSMLLVAACFSFFPLSVAFYYHSSDFFDNVFWFFSEISFDVSPLLDFWALLSTICGTRFQLSICIWIFRISLVSCPKKCQFQFPVGVRSYMKKVYRVWNSNKLIRPVIKIFQLTTKNRNSRYLFFFLVSNELNN